MTGSRSFRATVFVAAAVILGSAAPLFAGPIQVRVSPVLPSAADAIDVHFTVSLGCNEPTFAAPVVTADTVLLQGTYPLGDDCPASMERSFKLPIGPLPAGEYRLQVEMAHEGGSSAFASGVYALHVEPSTDKLLLRSGPSTFEVEVAWINQHDGGLTGEGRPVRLSEESGYFWFFNSAISEVTVKILDGRAISSHYWIFLASMTDVDVTVTVRKLTGSFCQQQGTCPTLVYHLPAGAVEGIADLQAF
jgi:hypothetical protein